jgi:cobalt/nickel transport system permease protein
MYYELLEDIAQESRIRDVNPAVKLLLGLGCILICISSESFLTPLAIALSISLVTIFIGGINPRFYLKLLLIPLGFAVFSVIVIIFIRNSGDVIFSYDLFGLLTLTVTKGSINEGILVFSRVFGGMCSLFFISLTTPATETFTLAKKCRIPDFILELSMLIYRYIFILIEQAEMIYSAQVMRLGYGRRKGSIESFGMMAGALFINSWESGERLIGAMDSRCYNGKFSIIGEQNGIFCPALFLSVIFLSFFFAMMILTGDLGFYGGVFP